MAYFAVTYAYSVPESDLSKVRTDHRTYLNGRPELVLSGPWAAGNSGALLIFSAPHRDDVETIIANDPFVKAGFVGEHTIQEWKPILGRLAAEL